MAAGGAAPGGEEKKNAFASFGGFSATSTPVAGSGSDSFGFLKKGELFLKAELFYIVVMPIHTSVMFNAMLFSIY